MNKPKGYKLPEVVETDEIVCIRAYVPNKLEYLAAFWGCYEYLTTWLAWELDDDKRGKDAAALFKPLFSRARDEWLLGDAACGIMPDPETTEPYDYMLDSLWGIKTVFEWVNEWLNDGKSKVWINGHLQYINYRFPHLSDIVDAMYSESYEDRTEALEEWDWEALVKELWCSPPDCAVRELNTMLDLIAWTQCLAAKIINYLEYQSSLVADWLQDLCADLLNGQAPTSFAQLLPNGGNLFGIEPFECPWYHEFDFTDSDCGFEQSDRWGTQWECGQYVANTGWVGTDTLPSGWHRRHALIRRQFDECHILKVRVDYTRGCGTFAVSDWIETFRFWNGDSYSGDHEGWDYDCDDGSVPWVIEQEGDYTELEVWLSCCKAGFWDGSITITKLTVWGEGDDPFA